MKTIAIDARFYGTEHTGLGRYTTNILTYLPDQLQDYNLQVLLRRKYYDSLTLPSNCVKVLADIPHYSLAEQLLLPGIISRTGAELYYALHFNVPLYLRLPYIVTIHDLIKTHFAGTETSTHNRLLFELKRFGYTQVMRHAVTRAADIIVPTNTVKNDILAIYNADPTFIHPIIEAPDNAFRETPKRIVLDLPAKYLLYVGNAYPHKNLNLLLDAFEANGSQDLSLVIVAQKNPFLTQVLAGRDLSHVTILSNLSDQELVYVYRRALALVTPSLMEGFGLPGLEALMVGTPVIASNIPVYREVYGDQATYFDPYSRDSLSRIFTDLPSRRQPLTYTRTWSDVTKDIAEVIDASCNRL